MKLLIKNAHCVDPNNALDSVNDILVEKKCIVKIGKTISDENAKVIDAKGNYVFPGLVDLHTHFREPGFEYKETIATGADAARRGGFVACVSMPNTNPACDIASIIETITTKASQAHFTIFPCGAITKGRKGLEITEMAELKTVGCKAVSDDGSSVMNALVMRRAMEYARMTGLLVMVHAEDHELSKNGCMNESLVATRMGLRGIPNAAEDVIVARDIELVRLTGAPVHFQHVSTKRSVELIQQAKADGLPVTGEATPHHIALSDEAITLYDTNLKMNPPLRSEEDRKAVIAGLKKGTLDVIATDHAPHQMVEKDVEFDKAPYGTIGLETALPVVLTELYHTQILTLNQIVDRMSLAPQRILGIQGFAELAVGKEANLCIVDLHHEWTVTKEAFASKSKNSCFIGKKVKGKVCGTLCKGTYYAY